MQHTALNWKRLCGGQSHDHVTGADNLRQHHVVGSAQPLFPLSSADGMPPPRPRDDVGAVYGRQRTVAQRRRIFIKVAGDR